MGHAPKSSPRVLAHVLSGMPAVSWGRKSPHMNQPLTLIMKGTLSLAPTFHAYTHFLLAGELRCFWLPKVSSRARSDLPWGHEHLRSTNDFVVCQSWTL